MSNCSELSSRLDNQLCNSLFGSLQDMKIHLIEDDNHLDGDMSPETLTSMDEYVRELEEQLGATSKGSVFVAAECLSDDQEGALSG